MELIEREAVTAALTAEGITKNMRVHKLVLSAPTIDPIHAAGGCYCRECCFGRRPNSADMQDGYVYCQEQSKYMSDDDFCSGGETREAQDAQP